MVASSFCLLIDLPWSAALTRWKSENSPPRSAVPLMVNYEVGVLPFGVKGE